LQTVHSLFGTKESFELQRQRKSTSTASGPNF